MSEIFRDLKKKAFQLVRPTVAGLAISMSSAEIGPSPSLHAQDTVTKTTAEKLFDELRGTTFQDGSMKMIDWARTKPHEILAVYFEIPNGEGLWSDLRGGDYSRVNSPSYTGEKPSVRILKEFIGSTGAKKINVCITHTHTRSYLDRLKNGTLTVRERSQLDRLEITRTVPKSVDPRGFTDPFAADGPFGTPPSAVDVANNKATLLDLEKLSLRLGVKIEAIDSVTNMLGIWYMRTCVGDECLDISGEALSDADRASIERLQVDWVKFINTTKNSDGKFLSGQEILDSDQHKLVVHGYASHGVKAWFVPKEHVQELKSCMGTY